MIDPVEANETYRAASAIAAFDAIQVAFAALVKKGILSKAEAEQILRQAIETIKTGGAGDQAAKLLAIALEKISKFEPAPSAVRRTKYSLCIVGRSEKKESRWGVASPAARF